MITRLSINWFKWLQNWEYTLWQDTFITWGNWKWKSRIIEAIIYCITWEVNWYKKTLKDCSVSVSWNGINMARVNWRVTGDWTPTDIKKYLCWIIPWYINSLTIKEKIKILVWFDDVGTLPFWIRNIWTYVLYKKIKKDIKFKANLLDWWAEETINNLEEIKAIWDVSIWNLATLNDRYLAILKSKLGSEEEEQIKKTNEHKELEIKKLKEKLWDFNSSIDLDFIRKWIIDKVTMYDSWKIRIENLSKDLILLEKWECYTCRQPLENNSAIIKIKWKLAQIRKDLKEIKILDIRRELKKIDADIKTHEQKLKVNREIAILEWDIKTYVSMDVISYTEEEVEDLKLKLSNFEELFSKWERKKILIERNKELSNNIWNKSIIKDVRNIELFEENEREFFINIKDQFEFNFDLTLYKENSSTDWWNLVYEIEQNWIWYFRLSTAQKLLIDTTICKQVSDRNFRTDFLLVDNWERLSKDNTNKLLEIIWDKQIILTKVTEWELSIEID